MLMNILYTSSEKYAMYIGQVQLYGVGDLLKKHVDEYTTHRLRITRVYCADNNCMELGIC